jgi:leucine dehydrogenase
MDSSLLNQSVVSLKKLRELASSVRIEQIPVEGHEQVLRVSHLDSGLVAIIAIHNTVLGPALGGTRIYPYASFDLALEDALRLSKGMTYKSALVEIGLGGGKSVIMADPKKDKTPELLLAFGSAVNSLQGAYIAAEDIGCGPEDVKLMHQATPYVVGLPYPKGGDDPGRFTAWGVFRGIQATAKVLFGSDSLEGKIVAIQGLGSVGGRLAEYLFWAGASLIVADVDQAKAIAFGIKYKAKVVSPAEILFVECDFLAPCAFGGILNEKTIPHFRCLAVVGGANNQLLKEEDASLLHKREILYAPDFVINAGGVLNVAAELEPGGYSPVQARKKTHQTYDTLLSIYTSAEKKKESPQTAALALAEYYIKHGIGKRTTPPTFQEAADSWIL